MAGNHVTIFSNGIADFQRSYPVAVDSPQEISIPVKTSDVADVLASLNVYGPVALKSPPSFRPANENDSTLQLEPDDVIHQLATKLSGSEVQLEKASGSVEGILVGLHTEHEGTAGERILVPSLVVLTEAGFSKLPLRELKRLQFTDEAVRREIEKSLKRNFQEIKPQSTFITLSVTTEEQNAEALLQYTLPAAAWKISYRLRREGTAEGSRFEFQGFAIVDNNTDEDWTDFLVSVVTGEPITFSTDLAESKIPRRNHVNVVKDRALGSVEVEESVDSLMMEFMDSEAPAPMAADTKFGMMADSTRMTRRAGAKAPQAAKMESAQVQTVGDFCMFESKQPVTILAHRSAVIPMFQSTLAEAQTVLHYKHENHPERPYRSVRFKNEMPHSLGRGVCTVYEAGIYGGSCILPATPAGETCLLPHALETGVKVRREPQNPIVRTVGIHISDGICHTNQFTRRETYYYLHNLKDEAFEVTLDHDYFLNRPKLVCRVKRGDGTTVELDSSEKLKDGMRFTIQLAARETLRIVIEETKIDRSRFELLAARDDQLPYKMQWLVQNLIDTNGPLAKDPTIQECLEIQTRLDLKQQEIAVAQQEIGRLNAKQDRLRKNLGTGGQNEQTDRWRADLAQTEDRITEIEDDTLPALQEDAAEIRTELREALVDLSADWQE